jgi:hypothetical protein
MHTWYKFLWMSCVCDCTIYYLKYTKLTVQPTRHSRHELGYRLEWPSPSGAKYFYLFENVQNQSGAQPASYSICTRGSFSGREEAVRGWSWPLTCTYCKCVELYIYVPYMPPWQAQGKRFMLTVKPCSIFHQCYTISCRCLRTKKCTKISSSTVMC